VSVTVSYSEAARMLDAGARVDGVAMPAGGSVVAGYVSAVQTGTKRARPPFRRKRDDR
jgi:hypothetical protein